MNLKYAFRFSRTKIFSLNQDEGIQTCPGRKAVAGGMGRE